MTDSQAKLKGLLRELFQLDNADLDFGIYLIMNAKRVEIEGFLNNDLLTQVKKAFELYQSSDSVGIKAELEKTIQQAKDMGVGDPETLPKVKELRGKLAGAVDVSALESQVFSDLYNFFRRYYSEGDFLSLRRYKEGVYAIPYEGEEVKLHWANHDQYYIKSSEYLRDYRFKVAGGKCVHFKVVEADAEKDNNKSQNGTDRRFMLAAENGLGEENNDLIVRFEYKPDPQKQSQQVLNEAAAASIFSAKGFDTWHAALTAVTPSASDSNRTVLAKHLADYTARNTFDYFIHKDLGTFLRRELDFFIKNEVMHLDDIESAALPKIEEIYSRIRILRQIADKIIVFLAQLENFQKKLWLKKKFVVDCHYLVTLDRVPQTLFDIVTSNGAQWKQWEEVGFKPSDKSDSPLIASPKWRTRAYLEANQSLVLDSSLFDHAFTETLLSGEEVLAGNAAIDDAVTGILIHSENFQAMQFARERFKSSVQCLYADPPYNTDAGPIDYKNGYRSSSWISLLADRLSAAKALASPTANFCVTIDDYQYKELAQLMSSVLGADNYRATIPIRINPSGRATANGFSVCHEYAIFYAASRDSAVGRLPRTAKQLERFEVEDGIHVNWRNFQKDGGSVTHRSERPKQFYPVYVDRTSKEIRIPALSWNKAIASWEVLHPPRESEITVWPIDDKGRERIWSLGHETARSELANLRAEVKGNEASVLRRHIPNEGVLPRTWWDRVEYAAREHGSATLTRLFGRPHTFLFPKAPVAVEDSLRILQGNAEGETYVLDYFAGSGTTAHAVINLNRESDSDAGLSRKFILIEMGEYFDTVLKPRVTKVIYSPDWKDGSAQSFDKGVSSLIKVLRLESYEDTLSNLRFVRTARQQTLLDSNQSAKEEYTVGYMLNVETTESPSLLDVSSFADPFSYTLQISTGTVGESKAKNIDLIETFSWLLGLRVKTIDTIKDVRVVTGTNPQGEKVLILWRNVKEMPSPKLDEFFQKQGYNTKDMEFDVIYVNGDNNLENLKKDEETWKVRLIEEDFKRLMFDVQDV